MSRPACTDEAGPEGEVDMTSLCFRCEHRALHLEHKMYKKHYQPRCECGDVNSSKYSCYMFKPVRPIVMARNEGEDRPVSLPPMLAARSHAVGLANTELVAKGKDETEYVLYWRPKRTRSKTHA